ncbi:hypothetical protein [Candidatus Phytoplasma meliae]|uniref:Uncharacterized protein n=1 Tax=Candidatus Phytoplasma meliae TaxID=1848402 RepID=A0ABS5CXS1_9MOLU|nr:hypothetical protein [Candidatus Phytoplasma meliae]MBP5835788.1 hypothetical protein [Candidatus Phytoplasma meliae]MBP5836201.1 hypothetical protein [Candidatus Phytoplasma meliae]
METTNKMSKKQLLLEIAVLTNKCKKIVQFKPTNKTTFSKMTKDQLLLEKEILANKYEKFQQEQKFDKQLTKLEPLVKKMDMLESETEGRWSQMLTSGRIFLKMISKESDENMKAHAADIKHYLRCYKSIFKDIKMILEIEKTLL